MFSLINRILSSRSGSRRLLLSIVTLILSIYALILMVTPLAQSHLVLVQCHQLVVQVDSHPFVRITHLLTNLVTHSLANSHTNLLREPLKKPPGISDLFRKGGGSRPIRNPYFDLVSEDPMLTGSLFQENDQVFRWLRKYFNQYWVFTDEIKIRVSDWARPPPFRNKSEIPGFFLKGSLTSSLSNILLR